jgi:glycosyltransferase involved in cell wall biosynthesis
MRILYFHQHFTTPAGAGGTRSYEMARRAISQGHSVTMVCGSYSGGSTGLEQQFSRGRRRGAVDGIDVIEFDLGYSNAHGVAKRTVVFLKFAFASTRIALTSSYDVVFATTTPLTAGIPGIFARWLRRKPFVFEVRDLWPELPREMGVITNPLVIAAMSALEWMSYQSAHRCIALSPGIKAGIARRGVAENRIEMVPNGCDLELFEAGKAGAWRPEGVIESDLLAVFTGTHGQANGLDAVLDAAAVLKARESAGIKLVLVGDGKLKPELLERKKADRLDNVIFHNQIPKYKVTGLLAGADIGIQCLANLPAFYYGTSPNKFFDYIAAGLPVLNNYPGWLAQIITDNDCGFAVPPDNAEAFADALETAAVDRKALVRKGQAALAVARDDFDRNKLGVCWVDWVVGASGERT